MYDLDNLKIKFKGTQVTFRFIKSKKDGKLEGIEFLGPPSSGTTKKYFSILCKSFTDSVQEGELILQRIISKIKKVPHIPIEVRKCFLSVITEAEQKNIIRK